MADGIGNGRPREMTFNEFTGSRLCCQIAWTLFYPQRGAMPEKWAIAMLNLTPSTYYRYLEIDDMIREWAGWAVTGEEVRDKILALMPDYSTDLVETLETLLPQVQRVIDRRQQCHMDRAEQWAHEWQRRVA